MNEPQHPSPAPPWWKFGHVWLVISGPAIVVVAGFITLWLAMRSPDPLVSQDPQRPAAESEVPREPRDASSLAPAMQGRNHAQTGAPAAKP